MKIPQSDRISQDEAGQWWYQMTSGWRAKMTVTPCAWCGEDFLRYPNKPTQTHCSRGCQAACRQSDRGHCPKRAYEFGEKKNGRWNGGRWIDQSGYVHVWQRSEKKNGRKVAVYILEHRLVMEQMLGRELTVDETVHHKNGIKDDNRPENLELWVYPRRQPPGQRSHEAKHCPTCTCF